MPKIEPLESLPIEKHRGTKAAIRVAKITDVAGETIVVGLGPETEEAAIVIGRGPTKLAALSDAQSSLQASLDAIDLALLKLSRLN